MVTNKNSEDQLKPDPEYKMERSETTGAKLNDKSFSDLLNIVAHCSLEVFDELVSFDSKTDKQREELLRVAMKSMEIATVISCKCFDSETFEVEKVAEINEALVAEDFEKANVLLGKM